MLLLIAARISVSPAGISTVNGSPEVLMNVTSGMDPPFAYGFPPNAGQFHARVKRELLLHS
jgi:hypothetical protein